MSAAGCIWGSWWVCWWDALYTHSERLTVLGTWAGAVASFLAAAATLVVGLYAWRAAAASAEAARQSADAARIAERAYVVISVVQEESYFNYNTPSNHTVEGKIKIINTGRTPAQITAISFALVAMEYLPPEPPYPDPEHVAIPLTSDDHFYRFKGSTLRPDAAERLDRTLRGDLIDTGALWLLLLAYVEYEDSFGRRHRRGYARCYVRRGSEVGWEIVTEPGYNYDIEI
jgi:hypothetical protein